MRKGLGKVASVDGKLMWTFTAPHLGHWIAAPLPSSRGESSAERLFIVAVCTVRTVSINEKLSLKKKKSDKAKAEISDKC